MYLKRMNPGQNHMDADLQKHCTVFRAIYASGAITHDCFCTILVNSTFLLNDSDRKFFQPISVQKKHKRNVFFFLF